ncbi:YaaC family protein [Acetobacter sp. P1H12_c]|uniref:YaaC family protein n=1 Tax=Acetobacter sp. P1H12_c TaxID=2762621 RepID=UPI001C03C2DC|nr:YaaC family protein [Acetobacter sp. P1H12_c]
MLEQIALDSLTHTVASNQPMFSTVPDYASLLQEKSNILEKWKALGQSNQRGFGSLRKFEAENNLIDIKDPELLPSKNTYLLHNEIQKRLSREEPLSLLPIEPLDFDDATLELAESLENVIEIKELYKLRKASVGNSSNAGISTEEAAKLKNCFNQGRELFLSGRNGSLMVKPLNFFYALTAYTYGVIVLNSPFRYRKDMLPGSHGMAYLPTSIQAQFGGDSARGTFSDLVSSFPTHLIKTPGISFNIDCSRSLMSFYENRFDVSLGTLLSMVPEMADYYQLTTGNPSRCFPLEIASTNNIRSVTWEFQIGNGETRPSSASIEHAFNGFNVSERYGKTIVTVPAANASKLNAIIYTDLRGNLWFVENPFFPIMLPEIAVHFLITSIFSNIMRYRPDEWGSVLLNEVSSNISLLTRHYFSSFQRKFMLLILRASSRFIPYTI